MFARRREQAETRTDANAIDVGGTGPFIVNEYVVGSHARYLRNPRIRSTVTSLAR